MHPATGGHGPELTSVTARFAATKLSSWHDAMAEARERRFMLASRYNPYYTQIGKDLGVSHEQRSNAYQQGSNDNPQADSGQPRDEDWRPNELHVDAGWRCRHASKKQACI